MVEFDFWNNVNNFKKEEFAPYQDKMDRNFIMLLDELRDFIGSEMYILCSIGNGSVNGSLHPHGMAVDIYFNTTKNKFNVFCDLLKFRCPGKPYEYLGGIGVYSGVWHKKVNEQLIDIDGYHLDVRPIQNKAALWGAIKPPENDLEAAALTSIYPDWINYQRTKKQIYVPLDRRFWVFS